MEAIIFLTVVGFLLLAGFEKIHYENMYDRRNAEAFASSFEMISGSVKSPKR